MEASRARPGERLSIEQFRNIPESDEYLFELDDGLLVQEPRPRRPHGEVVMLLGHYLVEHALEHGGRVTTETGFILAEDPPRLYGPDIAYVREDAAGYGDTDDWYRVAPAIAVEVISPNDRLSALRRKAGRYLEAGSDEVWIVDPAARSIEVHRPGDEPFNLAGRDLLSTPVLPGFRLRVGDVFGF